jgi:thimet oligopeptidase
MRNLIFILLATMAGPPIAAQPVDQQIDTFTDMLVVAPQSVELANARCDQAVSIGRESIEALEARKGAATIENDLQALDDFVRLMAGARGEASLWFNLDTDEEIRSSGQGCLTRLDSLYSRVWGSRAVYDRIAVIPDAEVPDNLRYPLDRLLLTYRLAGVDRDAETRSQLEELNNQISELAAQFSRNIADGGRSESFAAGELEGLPEDWLASHPADGSGLIEVTTASPDAVPVIQFAHNRETRRQMQTARSNRAFPENTDVLRDLVRLRDQRARLLGFPSHAHAAMADKMMGSPEQAAEFLERMRVTVADAAKREYDELLTFAQQRDPSVERLTSYDTAYFGNLLASERYNVDQNEVRQYFTMPATQQGIFDLMRRMFDVRFANWETEVWADGVTAWEMYEGDRLIGRFYLDLSPRKGKFTHAAQFEFRVGVKGGDIPIKLLATNFPAEGPMSHYDAETFLHEFGHLIEGLFADHQALALASRDSTPSDMWEAPSQFLEEWAWDYDTLATFAKNADGEVIPRNLVERMNRARSFGKAIGMSRGLGLSAVSIAFYDAEPDADFSVTFSEEYDRYSGVPAYAGPGWASWGHLTDYSSNYYTYSWSNVIAKDLLSRFLEAGLNDKETAIAYREIVLKNGATYAPDEMIERFLGRPLGYKSIEAYLGQSESD